MHVLEEKQICSGCHACFSACPKKCITMQPDAEGFLQPYIDKALCVDCGLCKKVCPVLHAQGGRKGEAYACINKNEDVRMQSSSGGVFSLLAEWILSEGGIVFGAAFDENFEVHHIGIDKAEDLEKLRGSKYVQSRIGDTYLQAKAALQQGKKVLFSGTPCQIDGLLCFLQKPIDGLYTVDIVCHGAPSPEVWKKYKNFRFAERGGAPRRMFFRHKKYGWKTFAVVFEYANTTAYEQIFFKDLFMQGFLANLSLRRSCYACHSKALQRRSDITLADFWGVEKMHPEMDDNRGTSLVFINSERGKALFAQTETSMKTCPVNMDAAAQHNSAAYISVPRPKNRERFFRLLEKTDFEKAINKCVPKRSMRKYISKVKRWIKRMCKTNV